MFCDNAEAVRKKAIEKITNFDVLYNCITNFDEPTEEVIAALERITDLIENDINTNSDEEIIQKHINYIYNINIDVTDWYIKAICSDFLKNIKK